MEYKRFESAGGQALIEGVMMKCGKSKAIAVRRQNGTIDVKREKNNGASANPTLRKIPLLRGVLTLVDSMIEGGKDLTYSANLYAEGIEEEKGKFELWLEKVFGDKLDKIINVLSMILSVAIAVSLFIVLPTFFAKGDPAQKTLWISAKEGFLKLAIFIIYLLGMSQLKDIKRVFQYHGAEHKSIFAYEKGLPLTVENVRAMPRLHPRCGTNFMFVVILISILLFTFVNVHNVWLRSLLKLAAFPLVAGISYEVIRFAGKHQNVFTKVMVFPGLMMQYITTKEPDDQQIEVAIESLIAVLEDEEIIERKTEVKVTVEVAEPMDEVESVATEEITAENSVEKTAENTVEKVEILSDEKRIIVDGKNEIDNAEKNSGQAELSFGEIAEPELDKAASE